MEVRREMGRNEAEEISWKLTLCPRAPVSLGSLLLDIRREQFQLVINSRMKQLEKINWDEISLWMASEREDSIMAHIVESEKKNA